MTYPGSDRRHDMSRGTGGYRPSREFGQGESPEPVLDELHFNSLNEILKRWPDELWAAKGKPRLWVKVYEKDEVTVWCDVGHGGIKLKTPDGVNEGKSVTSVNTTFAVCREDVVEVYLRHDVKMPQGLYSERTLGVSPGTYHS